MNESDALAEIIEALEQEGFAWLPGSRPPAFNGRMTVLGRTLRLGVTFPRLDFTQLPRVRLLDRHEELPGHRAHVEDDDAICYSSPGTLVLDMHRPAEHALLVLGLTRRTLGEILSGTAEADLAIEFPQHWRGMAVFVTLPPDTPQGRAWLALLARPGDRAVYVLSRTLPGKEGSDLGSLGISKGQAAPAFVARTTRLLRLHPGEVLPSDLASFLAWAERVDPLLPEALLRGVVASDGETCLFVRAPNGCVGVHAVVPECWRGPRSTGTQMTRLLRRHPEQVPVTQRLTGIPSDMAFAMNRNLGGRPSLASRRIVLAGCGTIGSHLAKFLAQSGAGYGGGRLDLVDEQIYAAANVGRHWLPSRHIGSCKAAACAQELSSMFRESAIHGHDGDVMEHCELILGADLVVDATGEEPVSVALNEVVARAGSSKPAILFVWLRGLGAAAQALYVPPTSDGRGCLRCLRPQAGTWPSPDVMCPQEHLGEMPAACGEAAFLPYGVAAPAIAAGLAARMSLEWAAGDVRPSFRTLRVDAAATMPVSDMDVPVDPSCPTCSALGS